MIAKLVKKIAEKENIKVSKADTLRIIGSIKNAGSLPIDLMKELIKEDLNKYAKPAISETKESTFQKIDAALNTGKCPICGATMVDVKLADYTPAKYCPKTCRVVLWPNK
jgi:rubrerythrin